MSKRSKQTSKEAKKQKKATDTPPVVDLVGEDPESDDGPARYFTRPGHEVPGSHELKTLDDENDVIPTSDADIAAFVEKNKLRHGDLVNFGSDRETKTHIVCLEAGAVKLLQAPDESGSGYLSIPTSVLKTVKNFHTKFKDVIENSKRSSVVFQPTAKDEFLRGLLGSDLPSESGFDFELEYVGGSLDRFTVKPSGDGETAGDFNIEKVKWKDIEEFFAARSQGVTELSVKLNLEGDDFTKYKTKYSANDQGWRSAKPDMPTGWMCKSKGLAAGAAKAAWTWVFQGPPASKADLKTSVDDFLADFSFEYLE